MSYIDPLTFDTGVPVLTASEWQERRNSLLELIQRLEYGFVPTRPAAVTSELLIEHPDHRLKGIGEPVHSQYKIYAGGVSFVLDLWTPSGGGKRPVILSGDACWHRFTEPVLTLVLSRGYALATFNRCEISPDNPELKRTTGLHQAQPGDYGAIAAWAWGYHRAVDALVTLTDQIDPTKIIVTGHSRGGKAALLAGATDKRVALTCPNGSGCGGAGSFRARGDGSERLEDILRFTHWFAPGLSVYSGREQDLPFDQDALVASIAPRAVLMTEALGDHWANPLGAWKTFESAHKAYRLLHAQDQIGIHFRSGGHEQNVIDWTALLDFADQRLRNAQGSQKFDLNPYQ